MPIIRREPFRELMSLREAMDRLFEESYVRPRLGALIGIPQVPIDVYDADDSIVVEASLPGVKPEDVDISVVGEELTIKGEAKTEREVEEEKYFVQERRYGSFSRSVTLPVPVNADQAQARYENGILKITLPKSEAVKPKQIKVKGTT